MNTILNLFTAPIQVIGDKCIGKDSLKLLRKNGSHYDVIIPLSWRVITEPVKSFDISDDESVGGHEAQYVQGDSRENVMMVASEPHHSSKSIG